MEITFTAHVKQPKVVELDSKDVQAAQDMAVKALLQHVEYGSFDFQLGVLTTTKPVTIDDHIIQMCRKYEVNPSNKEDRVSFFKAILSPLDGKDESCQQ